MQIIKNFVFYSVVALFSINAFGSNAVGDIQASMLPDVVFQAIHGEHWVLMDGRQLPPNSKLARLTGWARVPDARGRFMRMSEPETMLNQDVSPEARNAFIVKNRLGTTANFTTALPRNPFICSFAGNTPIDGRHMHEVRMDTPDHQAYIGCAGGIHDDTTKNSGLLNGARGDRVYTAFASDSVTSAHQHNIDHEHHIAGGDIETSPNSITVNYFILINDQQRDFPQGLAVPLAPELFAAN